MTMCSIVVFCIGCVLLCLIVHVVLCYVWHCCTARRYERRLRRATHDPSSQPVRHGDCGIQITPFFFSVVLPDMLYSYFNRFGFAVSLDTCCTARTYVPVHVQFPTAVLASLKQKLDYLSVCLAPPSRSRRDARFFFFSCF